MFLGTSGKRRWIALGAIPFIMNAIILTQSRGAFIGVLAGGVAAWYLVPSGNRRILYAVAPLALLLFLRLANDQFWQRMDTIKVTGVEEVQEASAKSRIEIVKANWQMFKDHPMGVGYRGNLFLSPQYIAAEFLSGNTGLRAAHNTIMAVLVDAGLPGAVLFTVLIVWVGYTLWQLKRLDKNDLSSSLAIYRAAIGASLMGLLVSGQFLNLFSAEVQIWMVALLASLKDLSFRSVTVQQKTV
jgi:O-antigen ligase